jgi:hypothetical protein
MKLEINKSDDSKGFWFRSKLITVSFHFWTWWRYQKRPLLGWRFMIQWRKGAGYIGGRTAFIGWRCKGGGPWRNTSKYSYTPALFRLGYTKCGNVAPYGFR